MQTPKLIKLKKSNSKVRGGSYWYTVPGGIRKTQIDLLTMMKEGADLEFTNGVAETEFLCLLSLAEKGVTSTQYLDRDKQGDTELLNRIIRAGGFCNYITELENQNGK